LGEPRKSMSLLDCVSSVFYFRICFILLLRGPVFLTVPLRASVGTCSIHRELEKVKFPKLFGALDDATTEAWLENMVM
jgi:hypothetical protein